MWRHRSNCAFHLSGLIKSLSMKRKDGAEAESPFKTYRRDKIHKTDLTNTLIPVKINKNRKQEQILAGFTP